MERNTYTKAITLYRKHKLELVGFNPDGIGETCGQLISRGAGIIEDKVGKVAHRMRMGPEAAMNRILTTLKTKERVALLEEWYQLPKGGEISPMLERDLQILLKYALPRENIETQITAFVAIASLITQYPPLKSIFLRYEKFTDLANPKEAALNLWKREYLPSNPRWEGFYQIAAACLSDDVSRILGATSIEMWGTVSPSALSVVDQLLAKISSERLETLDYVVIRYLGGILQLPTFWESRNYEQHKYTVTTLLRKLLHCIKETGIEHRGEELFCDREGIDILVDATLHGIQRWKFISAEITIQLWFSYFNDILGLLHRPWGQIYLPLSCKRVKEGYEGGCNYRWTWKFELHATEPATLNVFKKEIGGPSIISTLISRKRADCQQEARTSKAHETEYISSGETVDLMTPSKERVPRKLKRRQEEDSCGRNHAESSSSTRARAIERQRPKEHDEGHKSVHELNHPPLEDIPEHIPLHTYPPSTPLSNLVGINERKASSTLFPSAHVQHSYFNYDHSIPSDARPYSSSPSQTEDILPLGDQAEPSAEVSRVQGPFATNTINQRSHEQWWKSRDSFRASMAHWAEGMWSQPS